MCRAMTEVTELQNADIRLAYDERPPSGLTLGAAEDAVAAEIG